MSCSQIRLRYNWQKRADERNIPTPVDGDIKEYDILITQVNLWSGEVNKSMTIEVTDPSLLDETGGIIQGMSGSPILQNGKLIGAVTHVFVNNPTKGYGIFAESMINESE